MIQRGVITPSCSEWAEPVILVRKKSADGSPDLNKDLIFLYQRDLVVTGNFRNVVVNLDLRWYGTQLDLIDIILKQVETFQENPRSLKAGRCVTRQEIKYLYAVWEQLNFELTYVEKLLPMTRQKRGLLNFGGDVLNFLFGTATSAEIQVLQQAVENVKEQQTAIIHSIDISLPTPSNWIKTSCKIPVT